MAAKKKKAEAGAVVAAGETTRQTQAVSETMQLTSTQVVEQVNLIQHVMRSVMKDGEHYGIIPGTNKPTLLKPGAEKLCLTFRLAPFYDIERIDHANGHREYIVTAKLIHIPTGKEWGEGVGSCSTLEKKYRYRNEYKPTGRSVPRNYWDSRDISLLGGKGFVAKKDDSGAWKIYESSGQIENSDFADSYNTVLKMAKKRALVDATINACAASDIFTQDLEDMPRDSAPVEQDVTPPKKEKAQTPAEAAASDDGDRQAMEQELSERAEKIRATVAKWKKTDDGKEAVSLATRAGYVTQTAIVEKFEACGSDFENFVSVLRDEIAKAANNG